MVGDRLQGERIFAAHFAGGGYQVSIAGGWQKCSEVVASDHLAHFRIYPQNHDFKTFERWDRGDASAKRWS